MSTSTGRYVESAHADGAWARSLRVPLDPVAAVRDELERVARLLGIPVSAALYGRRGEIARVVLIRDPSRHLGTPPIADCERVVTELTGPTGWRRDIRAAAVDFLAPLGLRVGYTPGAGEYSAAAARSLLAHHVPGVRAHPVRLESVRILPSGRSQWHHEPGLLVTARAEHRDAVTAAAACLQQERVVLTEWTAGRTVALSVAG
jgi:hypothetical protein